MNAGITQYFLGNWFADCRLEKSILFVPDQDAGKSIAKLFGPQLKAVMPDLVIRVEMQTAQTEPTKPSPFKKSYLKAQAKQQKLSDDHDL